MPIGLGTAILGAGVLGAGASIYGATTASNAASNAAAQNNALEAQIYNKNVGLAQPYINRGNAAGDELAGFLGLGGDSAATQKAFNAYLNSTGYQFNLNQGLDAVENSKAVSGLLESGSTLKALDAYGTGLADTYGQQYVGNLQNLTGSGQAAVGDVTGAGENYAGQVSANTNSAAAASANASLASTNAFNGLLGNALGAYGLSRGASSFAPGASNAFSNGLGTGYDI